MQLELLVADHNPVNSTTDTHPQGYDDYMDNLILCSMDKIRSFINRQNMPISMHHVTSMCFLNRACIILINCVCPWSPAFTAQARLGYEEADIFNDLMTHNGDFKTAFGSEFFKNCARFGFWNAKIHNLSPFYIFGYDFFTFLGVFCPILFVQNFPTKILDAQFFFNIKSSLALPRSRPYVHE